MQTLRFYCKTMTCEAARARAVAVSACARVCSDLKRAMMAQIELTRTLRGTLSFRMSAARISSQRTSFRTSSRSLSRAWNNLCCASRIPFFSFSTRRSFSLAIPSSAAMLFFSLSRLPSYTLIAPICASRPATLPAATWCMPASSESDDSKSAMVVALPAMTAACSEILVLAASKSSAGKSVRAALHGSGWPSPLLESLAGVGGGRFSKSCERWEQL
mmetsp:Transcript_31494/g.100702  ORF Transcript_31494/g.100702 Transcript_31494/m.100702 type:complete len:217 (-) Transcript_31494:34-684(-)